MTTPTSLTWKRLDSGFYRAESKPGFYFTAETIARHSEYSSTERGWVLHHMCELPFEDPRCDEYAAMNGYCEHLATFGECKLGALEVLASEASETF